MDRPNTSTSPKGVRDYVTYLERELARKDQTIATLTRDATTADDWRGPFVAFLDMFDGQTPLARQQEAVHFVPYEDRRSVHVSVRWLPDDEALEIMDHSGHGTLLVQPRAANVVRLRKGAR